MEFSETAPCSICLWNSVLECFLLLRSHCHRGPKKKKKQPTILNLKSFWKQLFHRIERKGTQAHTINSNNTVGIKWCIITHNPINFLITWKIFQDSWMLNKKGRSYVINYSKWFHKIFSTMENPTPTDISCIQTVGFLTAGCPSHKQKPHSTTAVFYFSNAAAGEHKSWPGLLSQPDTPVKRKTFCNNPHAIYIRLLYFF